MKRKLLSSMLLVSALFSYGQDVTYSVVIDNAEDTTKVTSISDIIATQEIITSRNTTIAHFDKVWRRNSYFNIGYHTNMSLTPKDKIESGYEGFNNGLVPKFKGDWGASIVLGHSYRLHKKPIANTVQFYIDYNYIDLDINHYKAEVSPTEKLYDSSNTWTNPDDKKHPDKSYLYTPWCLQKYEMNYGMMIGPSITIAPFSFVNVPQLHYVKLNFYYHIGYHASVMYMIDNSDYDANPNQKPVTWSYNPTPEQQQAQANYSSFQNMENATPKMDWGHGLISSFGFSLSWKSIGIGYEVRKGTLDYKSVSTNTFGNDTYKFNTVTSRFYITIRH